MMELKKNKTHYKIQTVRHDHKHLKIICDCWTAQVTVEKTRLCQNTGSKFLSFYSVIQVRLPKVVSNY